ncbi:hypothetical protein GCM10009552_36010 [Rothia nasimurium]
MVSADTKLECLVGGEWLAHSFAPVFHVPDRGATNKRLVAGVPDGDPSLFAGLLGCLSPPYFLLYVLHTPRGEAQPGRYQSPALSLEQTTSFIDQFGTFLRADARYDLWGHSPHDNATVVWDRHNLLYGYGPVELYQARLIDLGFSIDVPVVPSPHQHCYRRDLDSMAKSVIEAFDWSFSELRPEDEQ